MAIPVDSSDDGTLLYKVSIKTQLEEFKREKSEKKNQKGEGS